MYQAAIDITIDGRPYKAGEDLAADCPAGCIESCLRLGQVVCSDPVSRDPQGSAETDDNAEPGAPAGDSESGSSDPHAAADEPAGKPKPAPKRKKK